MANMTSFLEDEILDHFLGSNDATALAGQPFVGLLTAVPSDPLDTITEVSGSSYARQTSTWSITTSSGVVSATTITVAQLFPVVTSALYVVKAIAIFSASTGGNAFFWGTVAEITLNVNDRYNIAIGNITVTLQ